MAFLMYKGKGYTVPKQLIEKYSLKNGSVVDDFSIINDKEFRSSFVEDVDFFKWIIEFSDEEGNSFFTMEKAVDQDEAKMIFESENDNIVVTLVCDFWDKRKNRKTY